MIARKPVMILASWILCIIYMLAYILPQFPLSWKYELTRTLQADRIPVIVIHYHPLWKDVTRMSFALLAFEERMQHRTHNPKYDFIDIVHFSSIIPLIGNNTYYCNFTKAVTQHQRCRKCKDTLLLILSADKYMRVVFWLISIQASQMENHALIGPNTSENCPRRDFNDV